MKKFLRFASLALVALMLASALASCGKVQKGTYTAEAGVDLFADVLDLGVDLNGLGGVIELPRLASTLSFESSDELTWYLRGSFLGQRVEWTASGTYEIVELEDGSLEIALKLTDPADEAKTVELALPFASDKEAKTVTVGGVTYTLVED